MTKIEFLSASLPYGLKVRVLCGDGVFDTTGDLTVKSLYELGESRLTPIVRPLTDLIKECVQADYNEGRPFVPIVELARTAFDAENFNGYELINRERGYVLKYKDYEFLYHIDMQSFNFFKGSIPQIVPNQFQLFQLLFKWHFNLMDEGVEVVEVNTLEVNPYKINYDRRRNRKSS